MWHFSPEIEIRKSGDNAWLASTSGVKEPALGIILPDETPWRSENSKTLISPAYGKFEPAPLLRAHARLRLPSELATLLNPHPAAEEQSSNLVAMRHVAVQAYEWVEDNANPGFCFALDKRPWNFGPWFSDAEFLYCRIAADKLTHLVLVGGTYVAWQGRELLKAPGPSAFFEWRGHDDLLHPEPGPFSIAPLFQELAGAALPPALTPMTSPYPAK